jgi:hypothetical protein
LTSGSVGQPGCGPRRSLTTKPVAHKVGTYFSSERYCLMQPASPLLTKEAVEEAWERRNEARQVR